MELKEFSRDNSIQLIGSTGKYSLIMDIKIEGNILHIAHIEGTGAGYLVKQLLTHVEEIARQRKLIIDTHVIDDKRLISLTKRLGFMEDKRFDSKPYDHLVRRFTKTPWRK